MRLAGACAFNFLVKAKNNTLVNLFLGGWIVVSSQSNGHHTYTRVGIILVAKNTLIIPPQCIFFLFGGKGRVKEGLLSKQGIIPL